MWLRLTGQKHESALVNTDNVDYFDDDKGGTGVWSNGLELLVKESIDEIEIMLAAKGAEVKRTDPHARNFIGAKPDVRPWDDCDE